MVDSIPIAVVTGGHSYDLKAFQDLFHGIPGVRAYVQHMDDFASSSQAVRRSYREVLFYIMLMEEPRDEGPWYCGKPRKAIEELGDTDQGIFVLHHALLAYPGWSLWNDIVGIDNRSFTYHQGETLKVDIAQPSHPITQGLEPWTMVDETYGMANAGEGSTVLLMTKHEKSMQTIAWTRAFRNSRVFCFQSGHDNKTWSNPMMQTVLRRGVLWCAREM